MKDGPADLVLRGGSIQTMDAVRRWVRAVAIRDGRIDFVGTDADVVSRIGPKTRVVELRGRTVMPGFGDAHVHPIEAGVGMAKCALHDVHGRDATMSAIRAYADGHPNLAWIAGDGWSLADYPGGTPRREDLDAILPDRPAYLENRDGHGAWVNSRALALAGIDERTPDPDDGRIERDGDGSPSGTLHEGAMELVSSLLTPDPPEALERGLLDAQRYLLSLGITSWQDASVRPDEQAAYLAVDGRGELVARVVGALWWEHHRGLDQIEELVERRASAAHAHHYRATSVKLMQDGVIENFEAAMLDPYLDATGAPTAGSGLSFIDPPLLEEAVTRLDDAGFQCHFHAIGDRAVRECLDAVAVARSANGMSDGRHHIAHIQVIDDADLPRFQGLRVIANGQPLWATREPQMEVLAIPFLGPERTARQYPFGSLLRSGAMLAMGSDWSVSTPDVLQQVEVAVERVWIESRGEREPFLPDERIDALDAFHAFTMGTAYVNHADREVGSLEVGKRADVVILDRDVFDRTSGPIGDARVVATIVDGRTVYETPALDG